MSKGKKRERKNEKGAGLGREVGPTGGKRRRVREGENEGEAGLQNQAQTGELKQAGRDEAGGSKSAAGPWRRTQIRPRREREREQG